jgi:putative membrane protein
MDGTQRGWGHMKGYGGYAGMFAWLVLLLTAGVIICVTFNRGRKTGSRDNPIRESPIDILERRCANGEISREEFDRIKKEIEN